METYIALLRGINIGKQRTIKMEDLKIIFQLMQFENVKTYIKSGNVVFKAHEEDTNCLCTKIESKLKEVLGYEVKVIVRTMSEVKEIITQNPFEADETSNNEKLYITLLSIKPTDEALNRLSAYKNGVDNFMIINREVYVLCTKNYSDSIFSNNFFEKKLGLSATTRNFRTFNKVVNIAETIDNIK
jgi:uncharacterized protein (DUF1697 family)